MKSSPVVLLACAVLAFAGCATVETRIQRNPEAFAALSPQDQDLVRAGGIREGFGPEHVFIAWGRPDSIRRTHRTGTETETWIYSGMRHEEIPNWEYLPYGFRGRVFYEPIYRPIVFSVPYFLKAATFQDGRVVEWEEAR